MSEPRRPSLRRLAARCLAGLSLASLLACGGGTSETSGGRAAPRSGGTAVLGSISDVDSWNEYVSQQSFANTVLRRIFLRLAAETGDAGKGPPGFEPLLAESWSFSEDRLALSFRLAEARWSDGRPLTAEDVRFTWQAQTAPDVAWIGAPSKQHITDVEALDDRTVVFHFDQPYPYQLVDAVDGGILPAHVFSEIPFDRWRTHDWSQNRIGSGPFVLEQHRPQDEIVLVRNPTYFREGLPLLDRVVVRVVPDSANLLMQLLSRGIDYMEGIAPREAGRVEAEAGITLIRFDNPKYDFIGWNGAQGPFDDLLTRRALTLAIDREALVEDLLYGFGRVSAGPVISSSWGADPGLRPWPYDPDEALRILAGKGYRPRASDGRLARSGQLLEFRLITNAGNPLREAMLVKIQEQLGRIGIEVEVQTLEMRSLRQQVGSGDYDAYLGGWIFTGKVELKPLFGSEFAPPNGVNVVLYRSPELDGLLDELDRATGWSEMERPLHAIQRRIHDDQPYTFLYETQRLAAAGPRLHGVEIPVPFDPLARLEHYWVDQ